MLVTLHTHKRIPTSVCKASHLAIFLIGWQDYNTTPCRQSEGKQSTIWSEHKRRQTQSMDKGRYGNQIKELIINQKPVV